MQPILECVPNFSTADSDAIEAIASAITKVDGAQLLHIDTSPAAARTVMTFAGTPKAVAEAAFRAIEAAANAIDMRAQAGVHPRIGATDVCPLVPLADTTMEEADAIAQSLGSRVGSELSIPVYLYEHSAKAGHRRALPDIRKGQYEGFAQKMQHPDWLPDFGPHTFTPRSGATVIGAREVLVAFNISLDSDDVTVAEWIASRLRSRGYFEGEGEARRKVSGLLPKTRAIGWHMADYGQAQVSLNLLDYRTTSPLQAFNACKALASEKGVRIACSEVIGLIPEACLLEAGRHAATQAGSGFEASDDALVFEAIRYLGLDILKGFNPEEKVLERALRNVGLYL